MQNKQIGLLNVVWIDVSTCTFISTLTQNVNLKIYIHTTLICTLQNSQKVIFKYNCC
jgi:hypothetical protein